MGSGGAGGRARDRGEGYGGGGLGATHGGGRGLRGVRGGGGGRVGRGKDGGRLEWHDPCVAVAGGGGGGGALKGGGGDEWASGCWGWVRGCISVGMLSVAEILVGCRAGGFGEDCVVRSDA